MLSLPMASTGTAEFPQQHEVIQQLKNLPPSHASNMLFEAVTGVDSYGLDEVFASRTPVPQGVGARALRDNIAELLGIAKAAAATLLDTSPSRLSRSDRIDARMLDRAHAVARTYVTVAGVLGAANAASWLRMPNMALDSLAPVELLQSSYGVKRVENLIEGLLGGAIV